MIILHYVALTVYNRPHDLHYIFPRMNMLTKKCQIFVTLTFLSTLDIHLFKNKIYNYCVF
jgi:hypothetical protein